MSLNATGATGGAKDPAQPKASVPAQGVLEVRNDGPSLRHTLATMVAKRRNCSVDDVSDGHILAQAEDGAALQSQIDELMAALGAKSFADALAKIGHALDLKAKLKEAIEGKGAAESALKEYQDDMVEEDVGMALASLGITDETKAIKVKKALIAERGTTIDEITAFRKNYDLDALRKDARAKLNGAAAQVIADRSAGASQASVAHLTASIATERQTPTATPQAQVPSAEQGPVFVLQNGQLVQVSREQGPAQRTGNGITLSQLREKYPSEPNDYLRKVAFVKAEHATNNPGGKPLSHDAACERAKALRLVA